MALEWWRSIPEGSHGTGTLQKRLWKAVSDTVRIRDYFNYGVCISCNRRPEHWSIADWQGGHYNPWSICRGFSKFHLDNIFGQCSYCNRGFSGAPAGARFKETIIKRYGQERMDWLETFQSFPLEKMDDSVILEMLRETIINMKNLPDKPEYYEKVIKKINQE